MLKITTGLSERFKRMSFLCASLVVLIHVLPRMTRSGSVDIAVDHVTWLLCGFFKQGVCQMAVPFFFFASGFFLAAHSRSPGWYITELFKRVRTLVVPFFIWCSVYWLYKCALGDDSPFAGLSLKSFLKDFGLWGTKPILSVLWYVRSLMIIVLFSPVVFYFIRKRYLGKIFLFVLYVIYGVVAPSAWPDSRLEYWLFYLLSLAGLFWFSAGGYCRLYGLPTGVNHSVAILVGGALILTKVVLDASGQRYGYYFCWLSIPFVMYGLFSLDILAPFKRFKWVMELAFPLYIVHRFLIAFFNKFRLGAYLDGMWIGYILEYLFVVTCSLIFVILLRAILPGVANVSFGGRMLKEATDGR